jgi:signal transduction histidine kinase
VKRNLSDLNEVFYDGVIVDITKMKDFEKSLISKNVELEKAYMELDRFVYSASHDLRAPLTSILGIVKVAETERNQVGSAADVDNYFGMIKKSVNKLDSFVQDIIHYYRNSRLDNELERFSLAEVLNTSFENLSYMKSASYIKFELEEGVPEDLYHDKSRILVIVNNLISNAIKYHKDEPGSIIRARAVVDEDNLTIWIEDNGIGIKEESQNYIFDMFYRAGAGSVGSGLGLYIVSESVKKLGGKISVDSTLGKGSVFCVVLPLVTESNE